MTPRLVIPVPDPFEVVCLSKKNPLGSVLNTVSGTNFAPVIHPLDRDKETCCYLETDQFGHSVKRCYNKVFLGRSGFLCKMHHDVDVKLKPQYRTIYKNESDYEEWDLRARMQREVVKTAVPDPKTGVVYWDYVQWNWAKQPMLFIEDQFGNQEQAFYEPEELED